jgi:hypothetical protein
MDTAAHSADTVAVDGLGLVSFVSASYGVVAQMGDYVSHVVGADIDSKTSPLNSFHGESGPISGPIRRYHQAPARQSSLTARARSVW